MVERARRLRVRPSQPGLRGPRETLPGPTTWVRPATGWWGRMNAGESPRNQGRTVWAPLSVSRRRSRGLRKNAEVERREANAQRHWACAARRNFQRWRLSALRSPHLWCGALPSSARGMEIPALPAPCENRGGGALFFCAPVVLTRESDVRARKRRSAFWRNEPEVRRSRYFSSTNIWISNLSSGVVTGSVWYS